MCISLKYLVSQIFIFNFSCVWFFFYKISVFFFFRYKIVFYMANTDRVVVWIPFNHLQWHLKNPLILNEFIWNDNWDVSCFVMSMIILLKWKFDSKDWCVFVFGCNQIFQYIFRRTAIVWVTFYLVFYIKKACYYNFDVFVVLSIVVISFLRINIFSLSL